MKKDKQSEPVTFSLDLKNKKGSLESGAVGKADCTFVLLDSHLMEMAAGKLKP